MRQAAYLSVLKFHEVLQAIDQSQRAVLVPLTDITRAQPSVFSEDVLVGVQIGTLVVSLRHGRSSYANLALRRIVRRQVASIGNVHKFNFYRRDGQANTPVLDKFRGKDGAHATRLGHTVTFNNVIKFHMSCKSGAYLAPTSQAPWSKTLAFLC